jgi:hypothetical protein
MSTRVIKIVSRLRYDRNITSGGCTEMEFKNNLGDRAIQDVMQSYPEIGEILGRFAY